MTKTVNEPSSSSQLSESYMDPLPELNPNIPAFIAKLWHMVDDLSSNDLIYWSKEGTSFIISDHVRFAIDLLPHYYKHNNMASFIRQLNMYGFHKVHNIESSSMKYEKMDLEFYHPSFIRGKPCLLYQIKRKITSSSRELTTTEGKSSETNVVNKLLQEVTQLRARQEAFESKMGAMKSENDALWREHSILRQKHVKQQKIVNKLIQFLVTLVQQTRGGINLKRRIPLMIKDSGKLQALSHEPYVSQCPIICEINPADIATVAEAETSGIPVLTLDPTPVVTVPLEEVLPQKKKEVAGKRPKLTAKRRKPTNRKRKHSQVMEGPEEGGEEEEHPVVSSPGGSFLSPGQPLEFSLDEVDSIAKGGASDEPLEKVVKVEATAPRPEVEFVPVAKERGCEEDLSLVPMDPFSSKEEANSHLEKIQNDLDVLKDILQSEGLSLDANALFELFSTDDPLSLNLPAGKDPSNPEQTNSQELIAYGGGAVPPSLVDIAQFGGDLEPISDDPLAPNPDSSELPELNTPQISYSPIDFLFPSPGKPSN